MKHGILIDLHDMGLRGHLPEFISNFWQDRNFQVRVGSILSDPYGPECVPCQCPLTVKHLLLECVDTELARDHLYKETTLKEVFNDKSCETVWQEMIFISTISGFIKLW